MIINTRTAAQGQITILELHGALTIKEAPQLREAFADLLNAGTTQILFDFGTVPFVDSSGLGTLFVCGKKSIEKAGNRFGVFDLVERVKKLLVLVNPISLPFIVFETEAEAVEAVLRGDLKVNDKQP